MRVLASRGTLVKAGVHAPGRWEWSPLYFKEISWVGSNAFGVEEVDGQRKHAIEHYLDLVVDGRVDLRPMLTHTFGLEQWRDAFLAIANQEESGASRWPSTSARCVVLSDERARWCRTGARGPDVVLHGDGLDSADHLDEVVFPGEDAVAVVLRHAADVLHEMRQAPPAVRSAANVGMSIGS